MLNRAKIIFVALAVAVIVIVFLLTGGIKFKKGTAILDDSVTASTTEKILGGVTYTGPGDVKVKLISDGDNILNAKTPNLERPIVFPISYPSDARSIMEANIKRIISRLKSDQSNFDDWVSLGILRKQIEDYEGAKEVWNYAAILAPASPIPFANLADLYGYYIKDSATAEINYLKAIENEPTFVNWYIKTADFFREVESDLLKARNVLEKGLKIIPNDPNLTQALENLNTTLQ